MAMSPSTIEPRIVEVYSVSPNSYYYISTTVQPPAFVNSTAFPSEFDTATGDFGNYQQPTNEFRTEKKHSARYQAKNTLSNYNPFSIYPKYRATYVPKKEHSVKVVSSSTPEPPPPAPPTVFAYIEEPYTAFKEQRGLSASRGASGALSPTETPPPPVTVTAAAAVAASTAAAAFVPVAGLLPRGRSAAAHMAASAAAARARRRPKALARRRQHRKSRRHHHASGAHRRRSGRFGVARSLLPPLASRRRISATAAGGPPETWQWQEGFMQPTERQVDGVAASAFAQRRVRPTQTPSYSSQTYSPTFTPTYSPTHPPTFSSTFSPTYSPTYDAPGTLAVTSTSAPLELQEVAAGVGAAAAAVRRSGRAPTQRHSRHQHVSASRRPNAIDDSLSDEEDQKRHRHNLYLGHDGVGENGSIPGVPGRDYPTYSKPPVRNFSCLDFKGRRGYVADPTTRCQVFYICPGDGRGKAMLCPNGTVFNQDVSVCDWWFNVKCGEQ